MKAQEPKNPNRPDLKREYCGCLLRSDGKGGAKSLLRRLADSVGRCDKLLWSAEYCSPKDHSPPSQEPPDKNDDGLYPYQIFALEVNVAAQSESEVENELEDNSWTIIFAQHFSLAREAVDRIREAEKSLIYARIYLPEFISKIDNAVNLTEVLALSWSAKIGSDGKSSKLLSISRGDVMRSHAYKIIKEKFQEAEPSIQLPTQRITIGFSRSSRPENEPLVARLRELKLTIDLHGNLRTKSPFDDVGAKALIHLFEQINSAKLIRRVNACPLRRSDETQSQASK